MEGKEEMIIMKAFAGNDAPTLGALQRFMEPYLASLEILYWGLWIAVALYVLFRLYREYRSRA